MFNTIYRNANVLINDKEHTPFYISIRLIKSMKVHIVYYMLLITSWRSEEDLEHDLEHEKKLGGVRGIIKK